MKKLLLSKRSWGGTGTYVPVPVLGRVPVLILTYFVTEQLRLRDRSSRQGNLCSSSGGLFTEKKTTPADLNEWMPWRALAWGSWRTWVPRTGTSWTWCWRRNRKNTWTGAPARQTRNQNKNETIDQNNPWFGIRTPFDPTVFWKRMRIRFHVFILMHFRIKTDIKYLKWHLLENDFFSKYLYCTHKKLEESMAERDLAEIKNRNTGISTIDAYRQTERRMKFYQSDKWEDK